ncbi:MAG: glycine cleavage system aminomethyltransferase GcvT [Pseudomonadota bacterium]
MTMKRTRLFEEHVKLGAKIVPFGGWDMPVSYSGVLAEHAHVRTKCGIFDVSHMGELFVSGKGSAEALQKVTINDIQRLKVGEGQYSALLNEKGGIIDDLILYRLESETFLLCVNASNIEKDFNWLKEVLPASIQVENQSENWSQIAVQGPSSKAALMGCLNSVDISRFSELEYMSLMKAQLGGVEGLIARTGYTGELGYEIYLPHAGVLGIWKKLLENPDVLPVGLGARDTLRLEACYVLYGNDIDETTTPWEAGIGWAVRLEQKGDFVGRQALEAQKAAGVPRKMVAFKLDEPGVPRPGMDIWANEKIIGKVTSGSVLPTVGGAGGMALLLADSVKVGDKIGIDVRGKQKLATVVKRPLYTAKIHS